MCSPTNLSRIDQSAILANGTIIGGLQSPPSAWFEAIVQGAIYLAAVNSQHQDLAFQQLEVLAKIPASTTYGDLRLNPYWDSLRGDPRFERIVASLAPKETANR